MRNHRRKTHKTALVAIPPRILWPPIQDLRRCYDRQFRRWMPHINILYPFRPEAEFDGLAEELTRAIAGFGPFQVVLARFRYFDHGRGRYTVWLAPEPAEPLIRLQEVLLRVVPDCDDQRRYLGGFTPHLSVGQVHGRRDLERFLEQHPGAWRPLDWQVDAVFLIARGDPPDDVFRVVHRIALSTW